MRVKLKQYIGHTFFVFLLLMTVYLLDVYQVFAATITWDGGGATNSWSEAANWSTDTVPTSADLVVFNGTSVKNAEIDSGFLGSVLGISISSAYTGTITQSRSITIGTSGYVQAGGTFTGGSSAIDINDGSFSLTGGTFTNSTGGLTVERNFTYSAGTFNGTNGVTNTTVRIDGNNGTDDSTFSCPVGAALNQSDNTSPTITFLKPQANAVFVLSAGCSIYATGTLGDATVGGSLRVVGSQLASATMVVSSGGLVALDGTSGIQVQGDWTVSAGGSVTVLNDGTVVEVRRNININEPTVDLSYVDLLLGGGLSTDDTTYSYTGAVRSLTLNKTNAGGFTTPNSNITVLGNFVRTRGNVIDNGTNRTLSIGGDISIASADTIVGTTLTLELNGTGAQSVSNASAAAVTLAGLRVNKSAGEATLATNLTITTGACTISDGPLALSGYNLTCGGGVVVGDGGILSVRGVEAVSATTWQAGSTLEMTGDNDGASDSYAVSTYSGSSAGSLWINSDDAADTYSLTNALTLSGDVVLGGGIFDVATNYALEVAGDWANEGGVFSEQEGTVTLNGANQSIRGSETFYNLTKTVLAADTLTLPAAQTVTVNGALTLQGAADQLLSIRSSVADTQAQIAPSGSRTVSYLDVKDSNNTSGSDIDCSADCVNSGNNTGWSFGAAAGISVSAISGNTTEAGGTATFTVVLDSEPSENVVIGIASSDATEGTVLPEDLTFTSLNWSDPQTVTVTGVNDSVDDGDIGYTVVLGVASSADGNYDGLDPNDVSVTNEDNDTAGISVSAISGNTTEAGGTATFTVVLDSEPTHNVSINLSSSDTTEGTVSPASLTFTSVNWDDAQTVTVTGVDDGIDDGNITYTLILASATSSDLNYNGNNPEDISVVNEDNDDPGVTISAISRNTTEAGGTATFTVVLNSGPSANVSINLSSSDTTEGTVSPASLTFTSVNWATPRTVTVTGVNDDVDDGDIEYDIITAATVSLADGWSAIDPADVSVTNEDNDTAGISVSEISDNTTEAGGTATFTVVLDSEPLENVLIGIASSDTTEGTVLPEDLTFTSLNWSDPQTVTVTGVDDLVADGDVEYSITLNSSSADELYEALAIDQVIASNTDDDDATISVSAISGNTTEAGGTATFTVVLDIEPVEDVSIDLSSSDTTEGTVSPASLTFTSANWDTPQTVTVTGVNDDVDDGDILYAIVTSSASSPGTQYDGVAINDASVTNEDNDTAGISVSAISGNTTEAGSTATFTVVLDSEPTHNVSINLSSSDTTEGTVSPTSLTFTSANWATPRTVTVTGVDDLFDDGNVIYEVTVGIASSTDNNYDALSSGDVSVTNEDNDTAGISVSAISGNTTEAGGTATFTVVLDAGPTSTVTVGISSSDTTEGTVSPASLTFTSANWATPQTITVTGVDDFLVDGIVAYTAIVGAASSTSSYSGIDPDDVLVSNTDNDVAGFTLSSVSGNTTEAGGTATFTVVLDAQPEEDVLFMLSSEDVGELTVAPESLTFTSENWSTPQLVTATGVDDVIDDGNVDVTINIGPSESQDSNFDALLSKTRIITNADNDGASVLVDGTSVSVSESGTTAESDIVLTSQPTDLVIVSVVSEDEERVTVDPSALIFTPENWSTPQTVVMTGVDNDIDGGDAMVAIGVSVTESDDLVYMGLAGEDIVVTVTDDDVAGITVGEVLGSASESGGFSTFTVVLDTEPVEDVTLYITSSDVNEVAVDFSEITFTSLDWDVPKVITLTGVDDDFNDGDQAVAVIIGEASSADPGYDAINPDDVITINEDDDDAGVLIVQTDDSTDVSEEGVTDTFSVVLTSRPYYDVSIDISVDTEVLLDTGSLLFTEDNWNTPQSVTVSAVTGDDVEGSHTGIISFDVISDDTDYNHYGISDLVVFIREQEEQSTGRREDGVESDPVYIRLLEPLVQMHNGSNALLIRWESNEPQAWVNVRVDHGDGEEIVASRIANNGFFLWNIPMMSTFSTVRVIAGLTDLVTEYVSDERTVSLTLSEESDQEESVDDLEEVDSAPVPSQDAPNYAQKQDELFVRTPGVTLLFPQGLQVGDFVRSYTVSTVYRLGMDGARHPFASWDVFQTYGVSADDIRWIEDVYLVGIPVGSEMLPAPGALIGTTVNPMVYMVGLQGKLHHVLNEQVARQFFGLNWNKKIIYVGREILDYFYEGDVINQETRLEQYLQKPSS